MFATDLLRPGRIVALVVAALAVVAAGVLSALGMRAECPGTCPTTPVAADGGSVGDRFWFLHRDLGPQGGITVRMTSMTGTITYPPPDHDEIVPGLVPWAKSGIIVKDGLRQGSRYAALMLTGGHGVRFQHDYRHDVAGRPGGVSAESPRWLRLTRSGDTITGAESADGSRWHTVGTARLDGLPDTVQVGLFATSPGHLTLREVALGGVIPQVRFTQAVGVFDNVTVEGGGPGWAGDSVGEMNHTDWERFHNPSGAVRSGGVVRISGTGDIGPVNDDAPWRADQWLAGLVVALIVVLAVAAHYGAAGWSPRRMIAAAVASFVTGLVAVGTVLPAGSAIARSRNVPLETLPLPTGVRLTVGIAVVLALCAVFAYLIGARMRRAWAATGVAVLLIAVPYVVTAVPLLPDPVSQWLLRVTPAAAFAVKQVAVEYPQVTAHYAPSAGYFPLPWWAGLLVLGAYVAVLLRLVTVRSTDPQIAGGSGRMGRPRDAEADGAVPGER